MICVLCGSALTTPLLGAKYFLCGDCDLRFLAPEERLADGQERSRYLLHQTQIQDEGYRQFVQPLIASIEGLCPRGARGLDFGAGHQPVLSEILRERGFEMQIYDPFFWPQVEVLCDRYDFVVACEVVEHFYKPREEFQKLKALLRPGGVLALNTHIFTEGIDFSNWYYRLDPTHVVLYSAKTLSWLKDALGFSHLQIGERVARFGL